MENHHLIVHFLALRQSDSKELKNYVPGIMTKNPVD